MHTLGDLHHFLLTRSNANQPLTRHRLTAWLDAVTTNARANQCLPGTARRVKRQLRLYKARRANQYGYDAIVDFWTTHTAPPGTPHHGKVPQRRGTRPLAQSYPGTCRVG
jgi:hypothetical protein